MIYSGEQASRPLQREQKIWQRPVARCSGSSGLKPVMRSASWAMSPKRHIKPRSLIGRLVRAIPRWFCGREADLLGKAARLVCGRDELTEVIRKRKADELELELLKARQLLPSEVQGRTLPLRSGQARAASPSGLSWRQLQTKPTTWKLRSWALKRSQNLIRATRRRRAAHQLRMKS